MTSIQTSLFVQSEELTPDELSDRIGVRYDKSWRKGDPRGKTDKTHFTNSWKLVSKFQTDGIGDAQADGIAQTVLDILGRISDHAEAFKSVATNQTAGVMVGISADVEPPLIFTQAMLKAISDLGVGLEIDLTLR